MRTDQDIRVTLRNKGYVWDEAKKLYVKLLKTPPDASEPKSAMFPRSEEKRSAESPLEVKMLSLWTELNGPPLEREQILVPGRKYRVDFLHEDSKVVIEMEGVTDHASIKGFHRDCEKSFCLQLLGYTVFRLTNKMATEDTIQKIIKFINKKVPAQGRKAMRSE